MTGAAVEIDQRYLSNEPDRHGNDRLYARMRIGKTSRRIRLNEKPGTAEFVAEFNRALVKLSAGKPLPAAAPKRKTFAKGTLGWLGTQYFDSDEFKALDEVSQRNRRQIIESCFEVMLSDDDPIEMGHCPLASLTALGVKRMRDHAPTKKGSADGKGARNNRRKYLSAMFGWAVETSPPLMSHNPARDLKRVQYTTDGFHTWTPDEVRRYAARFPIGTKQFLALALLMFTGVRRGDLVTLGRQHQRTETVMVDGKPVPMEGFRFAPRKTLYKRRTSTFKPLLPVLAQVIAATPSASMTFLTTEYGKPFTAAGFGGWFADQCEAAGVPGRAHGLRKLGATIAAENGATVHQLMAIYDWSTPGQAKVYTDAADQKRLAGQAMHLLALGLTVNAECRTDDSGSVAPLQFQGLSG